VRARHAGHAARGGGGMSKLYKSALNPHKSRHNPRLLSRRLAGNFGISDKCSVYMNGNLLYWLPNHYYTRIAILHPAKFSAARDYYLFEYCTSTFWIDVIYYIIYIILASRTDKICHIYIYILNYSFERKRST